MSSRPAAHDTAFGRPVTFPPRFSGPTHRASPLSYHMCQSALFEPLQKTSRRPGPQDTTAGSDEATHGTTQSPSPHAMPAPQRPGTHAPDALQTPSGVQGFASAHRAPGVYGIVTVAVSVLSPSLLSGILFFG